MHDPDSAGHLAALLRDFGFRRLALLAKGLPADDPHVLGVDAQLEACRTSLIAMRVASVAIDRSRRRGRLQG